MRFMACMTFYFFSMRNETKNFPYLFFWELINRVVTVREKSGKMRFYSRPGKCQGVLYQVREF